MSVEYFQEAEHELRLLIKWVEADRKKKDSDLDNYLKKLYNTLRIVETGKIQAFYDLRKRN